MDLFLIGFLLGILVFAFYDRAEERRNEKKTDHCGVDGAEEHYSLKEEPDQMSLRNGFGVTRAENPTFAEQWVNIMNYSGESQTEVDYEETDGD